MKTVEQVVAEIMSQPGIDISKRSGGEQITVETSQHILALSLLDPRQCLVQVSGTDPVLRSGLVGQMLQSTYDLRGEIILPHWIGKGLRMQITFQNSVYRCTPALSARIDGKGWHFDVF